MNIDKAFHAQLQLADLHKDLTNVASHIRKTGTQMFNDYIVREMVYFYDLWCVGYGPKDINPEKYMIDDISSRIDLVTRGTKDSSVDYSFSTTLFPIAGGFIIALTTEHQEFVDIFKSDIKAEDFSYNENQDIPDGLSAEKWESRKLQWDIILRHCQNPEDFLSAGYTRCLVKISDFNSSISADEIQKYIPKFDERCQRIALDVYINRNNVQDFRTMNRLLSDPRNKPAITACENEMKSTLMSKIDASVLTQKHSRFMT